MFLQIDHVMPLEAGGETNVHNTWRICTHHHFLKTYAGWKVIGEPGTRTSSHPTTPTHPARPSSPERSTRDRRLNVITQSAGT
jgi:hypothetical protein